MFLKDSAVSCLEPLLDDSDAVHRDAFGCLWPGGYLFHMRKQAATVTWKIEEIKVGQVRSDVLQSSEIK